MRHLWQETSCVVHQVLLSWVGRVSKIGRLVLCPRGAARSECRLARLQLPPATVWLVRSLRRKDPNQTRDEGEDEWKGAPPREENGQAFLVLETWVSSSAFPHVHNGLEQTAGPPSLPCSGEQQSSRCWEGVRWWQSLGSWPGSAAAPAHGAEQCALPWLRRRLGTRTARARGGGERGRLLHAGCFGTFVQSLANVQSNVKRVLKW